MSMFSARILSALPRRRFYTFLPSLDSTSGFALLHAYPSNSPHAKSYHDIPSSNTSTAPPPRNPTNHADAPPAKPTTQPDSAYWNDQSPAIKSSSSSTRPAPEPSDSPLTGQVESVEINVAPGVKLEGHKRQVVGAVLDLLKGNVTVHKMSTSFWAEDAVFEDNMNKAVGINEVEGHAWSLKTLMKDIKMLSHQVTQVEPNIVMDVENRYTVRSLNAEKVVKSKVVIDIDGSGKIKRVLDMWGGSLPEGMVSNALRRANAYTTAKVVDIPEAR